METGPCDKNATKEVRELLEYFNDAETGVIPDPDALKTDNAPWLWYMTWSHDFALTENHNSFEFLNRFYHNDYVISLDKCLLRCGTVYRPLSGICDKR